MLSRYTMYRRRPENAGPLPEGIRQDTRWRTKHLLRPTEEIVETFLEDTSDAGWKQFHDAYVNLLEERYQEDKAEFRKLADLAIAQDVYLGCNCPTHKNPRVEHCHTWLALKFMKRKFPSLEVVFPESSELESR
ncbi:DUF488 family protein, N3 subclade [Planctomicrobium sp. SH527]|uniref:DUF488 family protein, N3 subclade n=1 Tax=Planctomicrobium sp. SH527 TaxID=3448123 RepID=UPI003F5BA2BF